MSVVGAQTNIHYHPNGRDAVLASDARERNTTIIIGVDQANGVLLIDIDVQADVCRDAAELREQLLLIAHALEGHDPFAESSSSEGSDR